MLKQQNRNQRVPKRNDHLEILTMLDKCTQIQKEERLILRQLIKDENQRVIDTLSKYRKRTQDLGDLQNELRRLLNEKKGKRMIDENTSPTLLKRARSKEVFFLLFNFWSKRIPITKQSTEINCKECPSRVVKIQSHKDMQRSSSRGSLMRKSNTSSKIEQTLTPIKPVAQLDFMTIVSQTGRSAIQIEQSEPLQLRYNIEEINQFYTQEFAPNGDLDKKRSISIQTEQIVHPIPQLESLNFRKIANPLYSHMFTDWDKLLNNNNQEEEFVIHGVTAEDLFQLLTLNPKAKRWNLFQLKLNANRSIPDADLDLDLLFDMCDQDKDGWISVEDLGSTLEKACEEKQSGYNPIRQLYNTLRGSKHHVAAEDVEQFVASKVHDEDSLRTMQQILDISLSCRFDEIDVYNKGYLTYWDLLQAREMSGILELCDLLQQQ